MNTTMEKCKLLPTGDNRHIASFVVVDLEANDLPHLFSKIAVTELCMYGFSASELETEPIKAVDSNNCDTLPVPNRPRVLHKLTLLFNPRRLIHPDAENITGLNNFSLEQETHFDENAGNTIINFLNHMRQPVCLVAHNGDGFDFPVIKQTMEKLNLKIPDGILCVDSLRAFWCIDEQLKKLETKHPKTCTTAVVDKSESKTKIFPLLDCDKMNETKLLDSKQMLVEQLKADEKVNWQERNETTPKRATIAGVKRPASDTPSPKRISLNGSDVFKSKRALFTSKPVSKYPPKGVYKLGNLYESYFKAKPKEEHYAEADVETLMNLILAYGINFLAFAENHATPFSDVKIRR